MVVLAVIAGVWFGATDRSTVPTAAGSRSSPTVATPPVDEDPGATPTSPTIIIHVAGWVTRPGLVEMAAGGRVADAIAAAGGARPGAALAAVNLAEPLVDGQQVVIPGPEASLLQERSGGPEGAGRVRLNQADAEDLDGLPGIGPVIAQRIVTFREANGPFQTVDDLLGVPGIGERKLASIRDLLIVP